MRSRLALIGLALCLLAAACGGSTQATDAGTEPESTSAPDPTSATPAPTTQPPDTTLAPTTTQPAQTTTTPTTESPATTTPAPRPGAGRGFDDYDLDDPAVSAALSVRAGSAFIMLSDVFVDCLDSALEVDPAVADLVVEMGAVERGEGLSAEAADLAAACMSEPGYVVDVRDSWIGTETDQPTIDCLTSLFDVVVDMATVSASLQVDATEADIGGVTMEDALRCSFNDLLVQILSETGLEDITAEESQCIAKLMADAQDAGETQFGVNDFIDCLSDGSHNSLAEQQFRFDVFGTEGRCLNEYLADNDDPNTRLVDVPIILAAHTKCGTLGRFVNDQNGGRFSDDEVACINEGAQASVPANNAELSDLVNGCL